MSKIDEDLKEIGIGAYENRKQFFFNLCCLLNYVASRQVFFFFFCGKIQDSNDSDLR